MKKICAVFALLCAMFFFAACDGGNKSSGKNNNENSSRTSVCPYGTYECHGNDSYFCGYPDSSNDVMWILSEKCYNGCDDSIGKCKPDSNEGNNNDSGNNLCGNRSTDPGEVCDGDTKECKDIESGYISGVAICKSDCSGWDTSNCQPEPEIGDTREAGCTGLPVHASWNTVSSITQTWNGNEWIPSTKATFNTSASKTECRFVCNENYSWNKSKCVAETRTSNCEGLPENAEWNTVSEITQTWSGSKWLPVTEGIYNETATSSECYYKCVDTYHWENDSCISDTRTDIACSEIPENAEWNTVSIITQNWNGEEWIPSAESEYNEEESESECRFKCKENFSWNEASYSCKAMSRLVDCPAKPEHSVWNDGGKEGTYTQTWMQVDEDEEIIWEWSPSISESNYNEKYAGICRYKCDSNHFYYNSECLNPCDYAPCDQVANSTHECVASSWQDYVCECEYGYFWNKENCQKRILLPNICTGQTKCYNDSQEITCPSSASANFYGQDAQYAKLGYCTPQSFTVQTISSQKVVFDNNTGLMWQQKVFDYPIYNYRTRAEAETYCNDLVYAGYSDWRLPTPLELLTIVDNSKSNPAIDTTYFPDTPGTYFWSSYFWEDNSNNSAWVVDFNDGSTKIGGGKVNDGSGGILMNMVRCVRGEKHPELYIKYGGAGYPFITTTYFIATTLRQTAGWEEALYYCEHLTYEGYSDWRLPNKNELAVFLDFNKADSSSIHIWSSTTASSKRTWYVFNSNSGVIDNDDLDKETSGTRFYCIRSRE